MNKAEMTDRERFTAIMHYQPRDRAMLCHFGLYGYWPDTIAQWHAQGLPARVTRENAREFFGLDSLSGGFWATVGLYPGFEVKKLEDRGDQEVVQDAEGVQLLRHKKMSSIPIHLAHTLVDRESWNKHFKWRLDPANPERYCQDWEKGLQTWNSPDCTYPRCFNGGSLYGWLRNWMGLENLSYVVYDDPAFFEEMVATLADCIVSVLAKFFAHGFRIDCCSMWEDMCYNAGPLLGPEHFKKYLVPHYQRITSLLRRHGCDVIYLDCDGQIDELLPLWLEAGINCMYPIEVGTWHADPVAFRRQYGKDLLMIGGVGKRILAASKRGIEAEVHRLTPLVEEGGYIPTPDHGIPPDVSLDNYMFYLETIRRVWGRGVNLKPLGQLEKVVEKKNEGK